MTSMDDHDRTTEGKAYLKLGIVYNSCSDLPKLFKSYYEKASNYNTREAGDRTTEGNSLFGSWDILQFSQRSSKSYRVL